MKKTRFNENQIIAILKEGEAGVQVKEICRKHGISDATYYNWKSKYGGMSASDLKRMKEMKMAHPKHGVGRSCYARGLRTRISGKIPPQTTKEGN